MEETTKEKYFLKSAVKFLLPTKHSIMRRLSQELSFFELPGKKKKARRISGNSSRLLLLPDLPVSTISGISVPCPPDVIDKLFH